MYNPFYITYKFLRKNWKVSFLLSTLVGVVYLIIEKIFTLITQNPFDFSYFYSIFFLKLHQNIIPNYTDSFILSFWLKMGLLIIFLSLIVSIFIRLVNLDIVETNGLNCNQFPGQPSYHASFGSIDSIDRGLGTGLTSGYSTPFDHTKATKYAQTRDHSIILEGLFAARAYNNSQNQNPNEQRSKRVVTHKWLFRLSQFLPFVVATCNRSFLGLWFKTIVVGVVFFISSFVITLLYDGIFNQLLTGQHSSITYISIFVIWIILLTLNASLLLPAVSLSFFRRKYRPIDIFATSFAVYSKFRRSINLFTIALAVYIVFTHLIYQWIVGLSQDLSLGLVGIVIMYGLFTFKYLAIVVFALLLFHAYIRCGDLDAKTLDQKYNLFISAPDVRIMRLIKHKQMIIADQKPAYKIDPLSYADNRDYAKFSVRNLKQCEQGKVYAEKDLQLQQELNEFASLTPQQVNKVQASGIKALTHLFTRSHAKFNARVNSKLANSPRAETEQGSYQSNDSTNLNQQDSAPTSTTAADSSPKAHGKKSKKGFNFPNNLRRARQQAAQKSFEDQAKKFQTQAKIANSETDEADKL